MVRVFISEGIKEHFRVFPGLEDLSALLMRISYIIQEVIVGVKSGVSVAYNDSMLVAMAVKFIQHFSKNSGWSLSEGP